MNIILIISDTFRKDHVGCYGNKNITTPYLDEFSEDCIQFNNAHAASFPTVPCRADLFTGKYTFTYLGWSPLTKEKNVLAELLSNSGYTTIASADTPFLMPKGFGYDRGFRDFVFISGQNVSNDRFRIESNWRYEEDRFAPRTFNAAEKLLEYYYKDKFFLYIDIWDPHEPWNPPDWYIKNYNSDYNGESHLFPSYSEWRNVGIKREDVSFAHDCYCGEITMVDRWIGHLLDKVKYLGIWEDTAIIFTSDHGFYFGEHELFGKMVRKIEKKDSVFKKPYEKMIYEDYSIFREMSWIRSPLYKEITEVPLLIYVPGIESRQNNELISSVDIMPTVLDLAGIKSQSYIQGSSIMPLLRDGENLIRDFVVTSLPF